LRDIDLEQLEQAHVDLVKRLIRGKNFRRYLIDHCYPIAIDGSQKLADDTLWTEELLQRTVGKDETRHSQYFVYVLEASLAFHNGLVIPLLSEFLEQALGEPEAQKQDCELRAFARLSERLKTCFPRLRILLLLDGLYSQNNVHERCNFGARQRWGIKAGFLVEKHHGHHYEHAFALDWNAMQDYHLLMRLAHVFNTLARFTRQLRDLYQQLGVRGAIAFIRSSCAAPWLDPARIRVLLAEPFLLQLE
jgi:hypothetical protein